MDVHSSDDDQPSSHKGTKRQLLPPSFQSPQKNLSVKKVRQPSSSQALRPARSSANIRDVSVTTALSRLRIDGEVKSNDIHEYQASSTRMKPPRRPATHKPSISTGLRGLRLDSAENVMVLFEPPEANSMALSSPSHIPVLSKFETLEPPVTPCRTPKPSPQKTPYLTKDSNVPGFTAWDVDGRVARMEGIFSEMQRAASSTALEKTIFEEAIALYKGRG